MNGARMADLLEAGDCLDALLAIIVRARNDPSMNLGVSDGAVHDARAEWARTSAVWRASLRSERKEGAT